MKQIIKYNCFRIRFTDPKIEAKYNQNILGTANKLNIYALILNSVLITVQLILILAQIKNNRQNFNIILYLAIGQFPLVILAAILSYACTRTCCILNFCGVLHYIVNSMFFMILNRVTKYLYVLDGQIYSSLYYLDFITKVIWVRCEITDYHYFLIANIILGIIIKPISIFIDNWPKQNLWAILFGDLFRTCSILVSFWHQKSARQLFFAVNELNEQNEWFKRIVDSLSSGFFKVTNGEITYINQSLIELGSKLEIIDKDEMLPHNEKNSNAICNRNLLLYFLRRVGFTASSHSNFDEEMITIDTNDTFFKDSFEKIKSLIFSLNNDEKEKSIYLGRGNISEKSMNLEFELFVRFYINEKGEHFEFIISNVTSTKLIEEKNTEIKVKSTLLSKIVHEFKNPLICLSEVVDQHNQVKDNKETKAELSMIKSISNYLLILIKNIDWFTQMQCNELNISPNINITTCSIEELLDFIAMITSYLLHKKRSENRVKFQVINNYKKKHVETDEVKIKQLLLNLISNAVKFTNQGTISLIISEDEDHNVKFLVKDTGIGIEDSFKTELFKVFSTFQNGDVNKYGAGLGLSISRELSYLLGKGIEFSSIEGEGSEFWFIINTVPNNCDECDQSSHLSEKTLKIDLNFPIIPAPINTTNSLSKDLSPTTTTEHSTPLGTIPSYTILIADDEDLIRKSLSRILNEYADQNHIHINIIEASDGIESLWLFYEKNMKNEKIDIIISDENMVYYTGRRAAYEIMEMRTKLGFNKPKYYISSAYYDHNNMSSIHLDGHLPKPLNFNDVKVLFL